MSAGWIASNRNRTEASTPNEAPSPQPAPFEEDAVFLSYASEDRESVLNLKAAMEASGIPVWFDQRHLEAGDDYTAKILENIEKCSIFIPVISRHTNTAERRRFFRLEWRKAVEEAMFRSDSTQFILPVVIDDTSQDAPHILTEFKKKHWQWFKEGRPLPEFLDLINRRIRQSRREKRG